MKSYNRISRLLKKEKIGYCIDFVKRFSLVKDVKTIRESKKMKRYFLSFLTFLLLVLNNNIYPQYTVWENISNRLPGDTLNNLSDIFLVHPSMGWISSSSQNEIYRTTDFGTTWETQNIQSAINSLYPNELQFGLAGGADGKVYKTTDMFGDWIFFDSINVAVKDMCVTYGGMDWKGYICADSGFVWSINDTGIVKLQSGLEVNFSGISARTIDYVWLCSDSSVYFYDGSTFTKKFTPQKQLNSIFYKYPSYVWVVGDLGYIAWTSDSGQNWGEQLNPDLLNRSLYDVFFTNIYSWGHGWAVGEGGVIIGTTNFGNTWQLEAEGLTKNSLRSVHFNEWSNSWSGSFGPGIIVGDNKTVLLRSIIVSADKEFELIDNFYLYQNYPNPFNPTTIIKYQIPELNYVTIKVYDVLGNEVATLIIDEKSAGSYEVGFDGTNLTSGIYFYQLRVGNYTETKKMILLR